MMQQLRMHVQTRYCSSELLRPNEASKVEAFVEPIRQPDDPENMGFKFGIFSLAHPEPARGVD